MRVEVARLGAALRLDRRGWKNQGPHAVGRPFDPAWAEACASYARTPSRAFWDWAEVRAQRLEPLAEELAATLSPTPLPRGRRVSVHVQSVGAVQAGPLQVRGAVMSALRTGLDARLDPDQPELRIHVRAGPDGLVVAEDLAGSLSHHGYRPPGQAAPLREHLAAQIIALSGWHPDEEPLIDPMSGSGTLLAEAFGWARSEPVPRTGRWVTGRVPLRPDLRPRLWGLETDPASVAASQAAFHRLGAGTSIELRPLPLAAADLGPELGPRGVVVTNPPYGVRLGDAEEAKLSLVELRSWFLRLGPGWRLFIIGLPELLDQVFDQPPSMNKRMRNGPLATVLRRYDRDRG
jgi:23S rRNA G2445 N2-methylase RlmL